MGESDTASKVAELLEQRQQLTEALADSPYDIILYLRRAVVYTGLDYPDLASGDAYRALLLTDEISDESFEYHEQAYEAMSMYVGTVPGVLLDVEDLVPASANDDTDETASSASDEDAAGDLKECQRMARVAAIRCYQILGASLLLCGCLRSAYDFCQRGLAAMAPAQDAELLQIKENVDSEARRRLRELGRGEDYLPTELPNRGTVRREVYPWNTHEPTRSSPASLAYLNELLATAAPKCEVRATELPVLVEDASAAATGGTCIQLGVFAKEDIAAGEPVLREYSLLTANNRLKEAACDACGMELPSIDKAVNCPDCYDTVFCDDFCFEQAQDRYHPAVCEKDVDTIAKDPENAREADDALYVLLLARLLAMAAHQEAHPLEVDEVKYIWGDFITTENRVAALPFSFEANIATPLHILEKMDLDVFAELDVYDVWVCNTLYAKFRGTASARKSRRDGRPDVAAVHPLWCLANHDCDPNVSWEWGGRMVLWAREERADLTLGKDAAKRVGGIKAGQEILNHYCDINLPVQQRREWASGSLGGWCMCQRCQNEAAAAEA